MKTVTVPTGHKPLFVQTEHFDFLVAFKDARGDKHLSQTFYHILSDYFTMIGLKQEFNKLNTEDK